MMVTRLSFFAAWFALAWCCSGNVFGDENDSTNPSFVLLRNGNVLKGNITSGKERLVVAMDGNSTLHVDPKQVVYIGATLESLYDFQVSSVRKWETGEHWHLAQWCIQQRLLKQAIRHYSVLEASASDSPKFKQLEYLLRQALLEDDQVQQAIREKLALTNPPGASKSEVKANPLANSVVTASAEIPRLREKTKSAHGESEEWTRHEIPGYIRKTFQTSILPVLVSKCGQSGCHGLLGKSDFHIYQPVGEQSAMVLSQDLDEVLRYVNRDRPHDSSLLAYATKAHGIQRNPSLNQVREDERALIERISQWIKSLALSQKLESSMPSQYPGTNVSPGVQPAVAQLPVTEVSPSNPTATREPIERDRNAKLSSKPAKSAPPTAFLSSADIGELEAAIEKLEKMAGSSAPEAKRDPFDPEVFNRQYR